MLGWLRRAILGEELYELYTKSRQHHPDSITRLENSMKNRADSITSLKNSTENNRDSVNFYSHSKRKCSPRQLECLKYARACQQLKALERDFQEQKDWKKRKKEAKELKETEKRVRDLLDQAIGKYVRSDSEPDSSESYL